MLSIRSNWRAHTTQTLQRAFTAAPAVSSSTSAIFNAQRTSHSSSSSSLNHFHTHSHPHHQPQQQHRLRSSIFAQPASLHQHVRHATNKASETSAATSSAASSSASATSSSSSTAASASSSSSTSKPSSSTSSSKSSSRITLRDARARVLAETELRKKEERSRPLLLDDEEEKEGALTTPPLSSLSIMSNWTFPDYFDPRYEPPPRDSFQKNPGFRFDLYRSELIGRGAFTPQSIKTKMDDASLELWHQRYAWWISPRAKGRNALKLQQRAEYQKKGWPQRSTTSEADFQDFVMNNEEYLAWQDRCAQQARDAARPTKFDPALEPTSMFPYQQKDSNMPDKYHPSIEPIAPALWKEYGVTARDSEEYKLWFSKFLTDNPKIAKQREVYQRLVEKYVKPVWRQRMKAESDYYIENEKRRDEWKRESSKLPWAAIEAEELFMPNEPAPGFETGLPDENGNPEIGEFTAPVENPSDYQSMDYYWDEHFRIQNLTPEEYYLWKQEILEERGYTQDDIIDATTINDSVNWKLENGIVEGEAAEAFYSDPARFRVLSKDDQSVTQAMKELDAKTGQTGEQRAVEAAWRRVYKALDKAVLEGRVQARKLAAKKVKELNASSSTAASSSSAPLSITTLHKQRALSSLIEDKKNLAKLVQSIEDIQQTKERTTVDEVAQQKNKSEQDADITLSAALKSLLARLRAYTPSTEADRLRQEHIFSLLQKRIDSEQTLEQYGFDQHEAAENAENGGVEMKYDFVKKFMKDQNLTVLEDEMTIDEAAALDDESLETDRTQVQKFLLTLGDPTDMTSTTEFEESKDEASTESRLVSFLSKMAADPDAKQKGLRVLFPGSQKVEEIDGVTSSSSSAAASEDALEVKEDADDATTELDASVDPREEAAPREEEDDYDQQRPDEDAEEEMTTLQAQAEAAGETTKIDPWLLRRENNTLGWTVPIRGLTEDRDLNDSYRQYVHLTIRLNRLDGREEELRRNIETEDIQAIRQKKIEDVQRERDEIKERLPTLPVQQFLNPPRIPPAAKEDANRVFRQVAAALKKSGGDFNKQVEILLDGVKSLRSLTGWNIKLDGTTREEIQESDASLSELELTAEHLFLLELNGESYVDETPEQLYQRVSPLIETSAQSSGIDAKTQSLPPVLAERRDAFLARSQEWMQRPLEVRQHEAEQAVLRRFEGIKAFPELFKQEVAQYREERERLEWFAHERINDTYEDLSLSDLTRAAYDKFLALRQEATRGKRKNPVLFERVRRLGKEARHVLGALRKDFIQRQKEQALSSSFESVEQENLDSAIKAALSRQPISSLLTKAHLIEEKLLASQVLQIAKSLTPEQRTQQREFKKDSIAFQKLKPEARQEQVKKAWEERVEAKKRLGEIETELEEVEAQILPEQEEQEKVNAEENAEVEDVNEAELEAEVVAQAKAEEQSSLISRRDLLQSEHDHITAFLSEQDTVMRVLESRLSPSSIVPVVASSGRIELRVQDGRLVAEVKEQKQPQQDQDVATEEQRFSKYYTWMHNVSYPRYLHAVNGGQAFTPSPEAFSNITPLHSVETRRANDKRTMQDLYHWNATLLDFDTKSNILQQPEDVPKISWVDTESDPFTPAGAEILLKNTRRIYDQIEHALALGDERQIEIEKKEEDEMERWIAEDDAKKAARQLAEEEEDRMLAEEDGEEEGGEEEFVEEKADEEKAPEVAHSTPLPPEAQYVQWEGTAAEWEALSQADKDEAKANKDAIEEFKDERIIDQLENQTIDDNEFEYEMEVEEEEDEVEEGEEKEEISTEKAPVEEAVTPSPPPPPRHHIVPDTLSVFPLAQLTSEMYDYSQTHQKSFTEEVFQAALVRADANKGKEWMVLEEWEEVDPEYMKEVQSRLASRPSEATLISAAEGRLNTKNLTPEQQQQVERHMKEWKKNQEEVLKQEVKLTEENAKEAEPSATASESTESESTPSTTQPLLSDTFVAQIPFSNGVLRECLIDTYGRVIAKRVGTDEDWYSWLGSLQPKEKEWKEELKKEGLIRDQPLKIPIIRSKVWEPEALVKLREEVANDPILSALDPNAISPEEASTMVPNPHIRPIEVHVDEYGRHLRSAIQNENELYHPLRTDVSIPFEHRPAGSLAIESALHHFEIRRRPEEDIEFEYNNILQALKDEWARENNLQTSEERGEEKKTHPRIAYVIKELELAHQRKLERDATSSSTAALKKYQKRKTLLETKKQLLLDAKQTGEKQPELLAEGTPNEVHVPADATTLPNVNDKETKLTYDRETTESLADLPRDALLSQAEQTSSIAQVPRNRINNVVKFVSVDVDPLTNGDDMVPDVREKLWETEPDMTKELIMRQIDEYHLVGFDKYGRILSNEQIDHTPAPLLQKALARIGFTVNDKFRNPHLSSNSTFGAGTADLFNRELMIELFMKHFSDRSHEERKELYEHRYDRFGRPITGLQHFKEARRERAYWAARELREQRENEMFPEMTQEEYEIYQSYMTDDGIIKWIGEGGLFKTQQEWTNEIKYGNKKKHQEILKDKISDFPLLIGKNMTLEENDDYVLNVEAKHIEQKFDELKLFSWFPQKFVHMFKPDDSGEFTKEGRAHIEGALNNIADSKKRIEFLKTMLQWKQIVGGSSQAQDDWDLAKWLDKGKKDALEERAQRIQRAKDLQAKQKAEKARDEERARKKAAGEKVESESELKAAEEKALKQRLKEEEEQMIMKALKDDEDAILAKIAAEEKTKSAATADAKSDSTTTATPSTTSSSLPPNFKKLADMTETELLLAKRQKKRALALLNAAPKLTLDEEFAIARAEMEGLTKDDEDEKDDAEDDVEAATKAAKVELAEEDVEALADEEGVEGAEGEEALVSAMATDGKPGSKKAGATTDGEDAEDTSQAPGTDSTTDAGGFGGNNYRPADRLKGTEHPMLVQWSSPSTLRHVKELPHMDSSRYNEFQCMLFLKHKLNKVIAKQFPSANITVKLNQPQLFYPERKFKMHYAGADNNLRKAVSWGGHSSYQLFQCVFLMRKYRNAKILAEHIARELSITRSHSTTLRQVENLVKWMESIPGLDTGLKIKVSGRINSAARSMHYVIKSGNLPLQTIHANVDYAYAAGHANAGVFGVKVWLFQRKLQRKEMQSYSLLQKKKTHTRNKFL